MGTNLHGVWVSSHSQPLDAADVSESAIESGEGGSQIERTKKKL